MLKLTSHENLLFYHCAPELVVYNKLTRSTSLLPPLMTQIFSIIKDRNHDGVDIRNIQQGIQHHFNVKIDLNDVDKSVNHLKELTLIEYCE